MVGILALIKPHCKSPGANKLIMKTFEQELSSVEERRSWVKYYAHTYDCYVHTYSGKAN